MILVRELSHVYSLSEILLSTSRTKESLGQLIRRGAYESAGDHASVNDNNATKIKKFISDAISIEGMWLFSS